MADVERKAQELQSTQSSQDVVTLMGTGSVRFVMLIYVPFTDDSGRVCKTHKLRSGESLFLVPHV
jgi:hypothetical protein